MGTYTATEPGMDAASRPPQPCTQSSPAPICVVGASSVDGEVCWAVTRENRGGMVCNEHIKGCYANQGA